MPLECRGKYAEQVLQGVVDRFANERGLFLVWIAPGVREDLSRVVVEASDGRCWTLLFQRNKELLAGHAQSLVA